MAEPFTYNVTEAAKALRINPQTLRRLIRRGEVPSVHIGARLLIPGEALRDFLRQKVTPNVPPLNTLAREEETEGSVWVVTLRRVSGAERRRIELARWSGQPDLPR